MTDDLCFMPARELARLIHARKVSAREVMSAHLERIGRLNPKLNAIVAKLDDAECVALADKADRRMASGADEVFLVTRRFRARAVLGPLLEAHRDRIKPEAISEIENGARLSSGDLASAMVQHGELMERMRRFQETYPFVICAVNQVPPFDATIDWPKEIAGVTMEHYIAWMKSAYWISATFCPAISVPAGFTADGLPVGVQIVGRYRDDLGVLQIAHAFEQATGFGLKRPALS